ncbi:MAG TPA: tetratricopeptide repeat protein [Polyangiales bacterium]|nr:tetratricopeptide repeat protein [Polyangiales bacterium]
MRWGLPSLLCLCGLLMAAGCAGAAHSETTARAAARGTEPQGTSAAESFQRGTELATRSQYTAAEQALSEALEGGYPAARVLPVLLDVCNKNGRQSVAVSYAAPYLRLNPGDFQLRYQVAQLLFELGRFDEVRSELSRVLDTAPNHARAHYLLALTLRDHLADDVQAARHFAAYHRLSDQGLYQPAAPQNSGVF